ncbi:TPA: hypothetical protein JD348_17320 [Serratia marcescens]|nr:hypothetical protein DH21_20310 [Serratia marcescens]PHY66689.1 hypothetical protein CS368_21455 [Serratia marcescens]PYA05515.1 hypothetical protein DMW43_12435 [Serratia marcescens]HAU5715147.1 hypothetical protein [Serratia marcescens]HAU5731342.1 hypothetical protein [Serratia marcescens]
MLQKIFNFITSSATDFDRPFSLHKKSTAFSSRDIPMRIIFSMQIDEIVFYATGKITNWRNRVIFPLAIIKTKIIAIIS